MKTSQLGVLTLVVAYFALCRANFKCRTTMKGVDYSGLLSTAASQRSCLRWDSQLSGSTAEVFAYFVADADIGSAGNFCRNPNNDDLGPWCYTADSSGEVVKEYCDVPFCSPHQESCKITKRGKEYEGTLNYTVTGRVCQEWDKREPQFHSFYPSLYPSLRVPNYCRNPDTEDGSWCYTIDPDSRFEMCNVPYCNDIVRVASITEEVHKISTAALHDGDMQSCLKLSSQSANDFRFVISTTSMWTQLNIEIAFNGDIAHNCRGTLIYAFHSADSNSNCGAVTLCKWVTILPDDGIEKGLCRLDCSCPNGCQTVTLTLPSQIPQFELCEVTTWSWKTVVDLSEL